MTGGVSTPADLLGQPDPPDDDELLQSAEGLSIAETYKLPRRQPDPVIAVRAVLDALPETEFTTKLRAYYALAIPVVQARAALTLARGLVTDAIAAEALATRELSAAAQDLGSDPAGLIGPRHILDDAEQGAPNDSTGSSSPDESEERRAPASPRPGPRGGADRKKKE